MTEHKSGKLKQTNKKHKGATSKRAQKGGFGPGKVSSRKGKKSSSSDLIKDSRANRLNKAKQLQKAKRDEIWLQQRVGSSDGPPKVVGIIPLSAGVNVYSVLQECLREASWTSARSGELDHALVNALYMKYKSRCSFILADHTLASALDVVRVADIVILVVDGGQSQENIIDENGLATMSALKAVGLSSPLCCVQNLPPKKHKSFLQTKKVVQRVAQSFIEPDIKVLEDDGSAFRAAASGNEEMQVANNNGPASEMTRAIVSCTVKKLTWQSNRSIILGDTVECQSSNADGGDVVKISGYLRGAPMYIHSLAHVLGVGTCKIESIQVRSDPLDTAGRILKKGQEPDDPSGSAREFVVDPSKQESLSMESLPDTLMGEQTWPSEEELAQSCVDGSASQGQRNAPTSIPIGMSSYQADWYVDDKGNYEAEYSDIKEEAVENQDSNSEGGAGHWGAEDEDNMTVDDASLLDLANLPGPKPTAKKSKLEEAREDDEFPDEMDTPEDVSARVRFARYRNLQSFRTSPWHPKENLPAEYSRIFQFENFGMTQRGVLSQLSEVRAMQDGQRLEKRSKAGGRTRTSSSSTCRAEDAMELTDTGEEPRGDAQVVRGAEEFIASGQYVTISVSSLSAAEAVQAFQSRGFLGVFSLLPHENKLSVLHCTLQRCEGYDEPIKCKEELIFQVGFRSFSARPIFSENNLNCDKHKMERFFRRGKLSMASFYGPVTFLPCPVLAYKKMGDGSLQLVATGALTSVDPDRIMLKKVVLTGIPIRVRKRSAVIRQLFYDPQDVKWFKPAELVTKWGIRGHIKEPIGTHGLLKAQFGAPIKQNDTVMLVLYKRVFPKFDPSTMTVVCT